MEARNDFVFFAIQQAASSNCYSKQSTVVRHSGNTSVCTKKGKKSGSSVSKKGPVGLKK